MILLFPLLFFSHGQNRLGRGFEPRHRYRFAAQIGEAVGALRDLLDRAFDIVQPSLVDFVQPLRYFAREVHALLAGILRFVAAAQLVRRARRPRLCVLLPKAPGAAPLGAFVAGRETPG